MKSAAMEFGEYNIIVNALIPGKRLSETISETGGRRTITLSAEGVGH